MDTELLDEGPDGSRDGVENLEEWKRKQGSNGADIEHDSMVNQLTRHMHGSNEYDGEDQVRAHLARLSLQRWFGALQDPDSVKWSLTHDPFG